MAATAIIAFVFAVVVLPTLRGSGSSAAPDNQEKMTAGEVEESHAFYWRH